MELCQPQQDVCCVLSPPSRTFVVCSWTAVPLSKLWVCKESMRLCPKVQPLPRSPLGKRSKYTSPLSSPCPLLALEDSEHSLLWWRWMNSKPEYFRACLPPITTVIVLYQVLHFNAWLNMPKSMRQHITPFWNVQMFKGKTRWPLTWNRQSKLIHKRRDEDI